MSDGFFYGSLVQSLFVDQFPIQVNVGLVERFNKFLANIKTGLQCLNGRCPVQRCGIEVVTGVNTFFMQVAGYFGLSMICG